jgi:predicted TIM-barrel fold metal-dependent hydrolase
MIIDAHTHLFPDEVRKRRKKFSARDEGFQLLYGGEKARLAGIQDLLETMDREKVDQSVVCGFPWKDPGLCREGNDHLLEVARKFPGRILPFICPPLHSLIQAEKEMARCLSGGAKGIGELAFYNGGITAQGVRRLLSLARSLQGTGVPVLLHTSEPVGHEYPGKTPRTLQGIYRFLRQDPGVDLILAHWGGGFFFYELMPEVARAARRVYYDTAASPFLYRPQVYSLAVRIVGPDRILWGSDFPLLPPARYFREMVEAGLSPRVRSKIQGGNAERLFAPRIMAGFDRQDRVQ